MAKEDPQGLGQALLIEVLGEQEYSWRRATPWIPRNAAEIVARKL